MATNIRRCTVEDLQLLQEISIDTYNETYSHLHTPENINDYLDKAFNLDQLMNELSNSSSTFLFQYINDVLAGYLKVNEGKAQTYEIGIDALEIERIYVKGTFQDKGLGKTLLNEAIEIAKERDKTEVWLGVWRKNKSAIDFHKKMGFEIQGTYSFYMGDEEHVNYIMVKTLK